MKMNIIDKLIGPRVDPDLVNAYRSAIPHDVQLDIQENGDTLLAIIKGMEHQPLPSEVLLITEAKSEDELVDMVNDLIFTYKRIPEKYRPFYKHILKPEGSVEGSSSLSLVKS